MVNILQSVLIEFATPSAANLLVPRFRKLFQGDAFEDVLGFVAIGVLEAGRALDIRKRFGLFLHDFSLTKWACV